LLVFESEVGARVERGSIGVEVEVEVEVKVEVGVEVEVVMEE